MNRLRRILVATDFSEGSRRGLRVAAELARLNGASCRVVHALETEPEPSGSAGSGPDSEVIRRIEEEISSEIQATTDAAGAFEAVARVGRTVQVILGEAEEYGADLIVAGANGSRGKTRLGTIAVRLVRRGTGRVLLASPAASGRFRRVVAAVDFSPVSKEVVEQAVRLASLSGAALDLVHAFEVPWERVRFSRAPEGAHEAIPEIRAEYEAQLREVYDSIDDRPEVGEVGFHALQNADHATAIIDFANARDADAVVLATTGRTTIAYILLGTTAEKVLREVGCSVLAVRKQTGASEHAEARAPEGASL